MRRRLQSAADQQRLCDAWNDRYEVGQEVAVRKDDGESVLTTTRSAAEVLGGHTAVIWLDGIRGCYLLDRVSALAPELAHG